MRHYVDVVCERRKPEAGFVDFPFSHPTSDFFFFARAALVYNLPRVAWRLTTERSNATNAPRTKSISIFFSSARTKHKLPRSRIGDFILEYRRVQNALMAGGAMLAA